MFAIDASYRSLETPTFQAFHPDRDTISVPIHQLNAIASIVEEHEQTTVTNIALEICFDDPKEPIEALAHVDGFRMKVDRY
jgi:predicted 2-oxoglutarate/Fe(II)-dependent dioxygenase YbiX